MRITLIALLLVGLAWTSLQAAEAPSPTEEILVALKAENTMLKEQQTDLAERLRIALIDVDFLKKQRTGYLQYLEEWVDENIRLKALLREAGIDPGEKVEVEIEVEEPPKEPTPQPKGRLALILRAIKEKEKEISHFLEAIREKRKDLEKLEEEKRALMTEPKVQRDVIYRPDK